MAATAHPDVAQAYASGVRALFAVPVEAARARDLEASPWPQVLADQAESLSELSATLADAVAANLSAPEPEARLAASSRLLAKALADFEVSAYLLDAAVTEEGGEWSGERGLEDLDVVESALAVIEGDVQAQWLLGARGLPPVDIPSARAALANAIGETLTSISTHAKVNGQAALGGLLALGAGEVARAAGLVGMEIATALGQAEKAARLYALFRDFALKAYNSLLSLLGQQLAQMGAQKMLEWVEELRQGRLFGDLLERLYETEETAAELRQFAATAPASLEQFIAAIEGIERLDAASEQQSQLVKKILRSVTFLAGVPAAALPQAKALLAAAYIAAGSWVVFAGADYVDTRRLRRIDRIPGIRRVVETSLVSG